MGRRVPHTVEGYPFPDFRPKRYCTTFDAVKGRSPAPVERTAVDAATNLAPESIELLALDPYIPLAASKNSRLLMVFGRPIEVQFF